MIANKLRIFITPAVCSGDVSGVDYRRVHDAVCGGGALAATQQLLEQYVDQSLGLLRTFGDNDATKAIEKIATSIL